MAREFDFNLKLNTLLNSEGLVKLESSIKTFSRDSAKSLGKVSKNFDRIGRSAEKLGKSLSLKLTAPLAALGAFSLRSFGKFDDGFKGVQTLLDSNSFSGTSFSQGLKDLETGLLRINSSQGLGLEKLNKALFDTISSGVDASKAIVALESAGKLAVAGLTDVSIATDGITSALNAFNIDASQAEVVASKFFNAQKAGKTTVAELASGFGLVASNAASAGVSLDELLGATSAITLGGVRTNSAFTGLKAALVGITKPTQDAVKEASRLGIEFNSAALRSKGLEKFISELVNSPNFGPDSIAKLFSSSEAQSSLNALVSKIDQFKSATASIGDNTGGLTTLNNAFNTQSESFGQVLARLSSRFENFRVLIGQQLAPTFSKLADILGDFFSTLENNPSLTKFIVVMGSMLAVLGPLLVVFGKLSVLFSAISGPVSKLLLNFSKLRSKFSGFSGVAKNITKVMPRLVNAFGFLRQVAVRLIAGFTAINLIIISVGIAFIKIEKDTSAISEVFKAVIEIIFSLFKVFLDFIGVTKLFNVSIRSMSDLLRGLASLITGVITLAFNGLVGTIGILVIGVIKLVKAVGSLKPFGKSLVSEKTLKSLSEAERKVDSLIKKSANSIQLTLGLRKPEKQELESVATETKKEVEKKIIDQNKLDLNLELKVDESKLQSLKDRLAQIKLENKKDLGVLDLELVARVARDQFKDEIESARKLGLDIKPIELKIELLVEAAKFEDLNKEITSLTQKFDQAKSKANDLKDAVGPVAAFEFRANFAADNSEDTQAALQKLKSFRETVQNQATQNQVDKLILRIQAEQDDAAEFTVLAKVSELNDKLRQEENILKLKFNGPLLERELGNLRANTKIQLDNIVNDAVQANPSINVDNLKKNSREIISNYNDIKSAQEDSLSGEATRLAAANISSSFDGIVEGTKTVSEAFSSLASNIIKSLTQQALTKAITSIFSQNGASASNAGGFGSAIASIFARSGGLIKNGGLSIPAFMTGGAVQNSPNGKLSGPGTGTSDSILARVSNGEFVTNKKTVDFFGSDFFSKLQAFAGAGINPFESLNFATGGLVTALNSASYNISSISNVPRFQAGGPIGRQNAGAFQQQTAVNIEIKNEGTAKQVSSFDRDQVTGQIRSIVLSDVQRNGPISQNIQSAFGLNRAGGN